MLTAEKEFELGHSLPCRARGPGRDAHKQHGTDLVDLSDETDCEAMSWRGWLKPETLVLAGRGGIIGWVAFVGGAGLGRGRVDPVVRSASVVLSVPDLG